MDHKVERPRLVSRPDRVRIVRPPTEGPVVVAVAGPVVVDPELRADEFPRAQHGAEDGIDHTPADLVEVAEIQVPPTIAHAFTVDPGAVDEVNRALLEVDDRLRGARPVRPPTPCTRASSSGV